MGVQAYLTRLALGRSAYERLSHGQENGPDPVRRTAPLTQLSNQQSDHLADCPNEPPNQGDDQYIQQYDNRGYPRNPSSRALSRRSRRAQNDVLATVGVLLYPDQFAQETPHAQKLSEPSSAQTQQDVAAESMLSYTLYDTHLALDILSHSCMACARHRIQTFRFYTGVPFHRVFNTEWRVFGPLFFLFGGLSGDFWSFIMLDSQDMFYEIARCASEDYMVKLLAQARSGLFQRSLRISASIIKLCLRAFHWSIFATFRFHSILQGLGLRPPSLTSPTWTDCVPATAGSLIRPIHLPTSLNLRSGFGYLASVATSPLALLCLFDTLQHTIRSKAFTYIRLALPRPDNPDSKFNVGRMYRGEKFLGRHVLSEGVPLQRLPTIRGQAHKDWTAFCNYFKSLISWWTPPIIRTTSSNPVTSALERPNTSHEALVARTSSPSAQDGHEDLVELSDGATASDPPSPERNHRAADSERNITRRASRSGSNDWQADVEGSELGITAPRSFYFPTDPSKPAYRVTQFSTLMVDTLATTLSSIVADILLLPLEALLVRSVASTYLNTPSGAAYSTMGLRHEIYPLRSWAGMGLGGGRIMDYVRKMTLCLGVDILLRLAVWQATVGAAWWWGRRNPSGEEDRK